MQGKTLLFNLIIENGCYGKNLRDVSRKINEIEKYERDTGVRLFI
ncbi:hypothetical Protein YC6258_03408 [Gynuella sunshinyii YC6258]|uniref:Uncharacterized protein n=1 Tax=Gynuella sunshinyii YC6258 TaxID=1445510 RepID=A0A0C5VYH1_9GAMM|nr:hypothetical Protein YC6258_03408 [Gynuella sunshinyii YC6258]